MTSETIKCPNSPTVEYEVSVHYHEAQLYSTESNARQDWRRLDDKTKEVFSIKQTKLKFIEMDSHYSD